MLVEVYNLVYRNRVLKRIGNEFCEFYIFVTP